MVGFSNFSTGNLASKAVSGITSRFRPQQRPLAYDAAPSGPDTATAALAAYGQQQQANPYSIAYGAYGAPALAGADLALAQLRQNLGNTYANQGVQSRYLGQQQGFADQRNALDQQGLALERQGLGDRSQYLAQGFSLDSQANNLQAGDVFRQQQVNPEYERMANEAFGLQESDLRRQTLAAKQAAESQAVGRGSLGSAGHGRDISNLDADLSSSLAGIGLDRSKSALDFMQKRLGLQDQAIGAEITGGKLQNQFNYNKQQLASANKQLDIESKKLGLSGQETKARIQNALDQLGISTAADVNSILLEMNKIDQGLISTLPPQILTAIRQLTGIGVGG